MKKKMYKLIGILTILGLLSVFCIMSSAAEAQGVEHNTVFSLRNVNSGKYLNVHAGTDANGTNVYQYTANGAVAQNFTAFYSGGYYRFYAMIGSKSRVVRAVKSGSSVANGSNVEISLPTDSDTHEWNIVYLGAGKYKVTLRSNSNLALTAYGTANGTSGGKSSTSAGNVYVSTYTGSSSQQWYLEPKSIPRLVPDGIYYIRNKAGFFLDVDNGSTDNSTPTHQYTFHGSTNQQWQLTYRNGVYKILPVCAPGKALDVQGGSVANGAQIQIYDDTRAIGQEWKLLSNTDGSYKIASRVSTYAKLAVIQGASQDSGAAIIQYQNNDGWNEDWYFDAADNYIGELKIYSTSDGGSSALSTKGHSYIVFQSYRNYPVTFGHFEVSLAYHVSIGTWQESSSIAGRDYSGIWYNMESRLPYTFHENSAMLRMNIRANQLPLINDFIYQNDTWSTLNNCSSFASKLWNTVSNIKVDAGLVNTPYTLQQNILSKDGHTYGDPIPYITPIGYYNNDWFDRTSYFPNQNNDPYPYAIQSYDDETAQKLKQMMVANGTIT